MWWVVLVLLSCQDRELAAGAGVGPSRGRRSEESGGPRGAGPWTRMDGVERRGLGDPPQATRRAKRGFTYPGTLWCGAGNMADHYDQLGKYEETDRCCRTHDHCPHVIQAFSSKYGHTNFKWHSISHCDCDEALKGCLRRVNDTSSRVMGQAFFNVIGAPCFELVYEERCAERRWYGPCKQYEKLPVAVVKEAVPYDYGGVAVIDVLTRAPPERKRDIELETPTQATLFGPEEPSLGNTGATTATAAEDFVKALATVPTASAADSDKESQSSDGKRAKKKDRAEKKTKKRNGQKRRQKVVRLEGVGTVLASGGKKAVEKVPSRNSVGDQTATQRLSDGQSARSSNDVLKDEALMGTGQGRTGAPPGSPPKTGRGEDKVPLAAPKEIPQLTNNLTAPLMSHPERRPGEETSPPGVKSADISGVTFPWTAGEAGPPAGARPKTGLPRKGRRKEIPPPPVDSPKSLPVIPSFQQRRPGKEISQAAVRSTGNLVVASPQTAEKSSPPAGSLSKTKRPRKGGRKDELPATLPEEAPQLALDFAENRSAATLPANLTSQRHSSKRIPQPAGDFTNNLRVTSPTTEETAPPVWSLSKNRRARKSRRKEKALPTSAKEVAQPAVDRADNLRAVLTSGAQRRDPAEKGPQTHSAGIPSVSSALTVRTPLAAGIPKSAARPADLQSLLSIQVMPTWQQDLGEEISPSAVDSNSSPSATRTPASQAQLGPAPSGSAMLGLQPVRQKAAGPGPPGPPKIKRNRSGERGDNGGRKKERKALPDPGAASVTPAGPPQSRDIVPAVGILKRQKMKAASESVPLASLTTSAAADPLVGLARGTGPRKLGRNAAPANAHRGSATSEFPALTSAPEERAEKRRAGVSAARLVGAVRRSMERAEEQFAWKKRRKALGTIA